MSTTDDDEADRLGRLADAVASGAKGAEPIAGSGGDGGNEGGAGGEGAELVPEAPAIDDAARATAAALLGAGLSEAAIGEALDAAFEARPRLPVPVPPGYELLEEIGRGGGGVVYRARQLALDREVAIKVLHPGDGLFDAAIRRFEREARALARVRHPGIVSVHEVGSTGGRLWYAMDLVEGTSLADELAEGPYAPEDGARLVRGVADAVAAVHGHGLVHRDLKPANVLLDATGRPYVGDFGLALELGGGADDLTLTGQVIGTPAYMAPEQAKGEGASVGPATDVYALGAILYEVLGGRRPFAGLSPPEQVYAAIHRDPTPLRRVRRDVPENLARIVEKAMRKRPADRYATARALVDDLDRFLAGESVLASPGRARRFATLVRRRAGVLGWVAAVAVGAVALVPRLLRDERTSTASALVEAADEAAKEGDAESAVRLYARAAAASPTPLASSVRLRAAEAEVPRARRLIEEGRAEEVLRRADERLAELGAGREVDEPGPWSWVRGMGLAALDRREEASKAFRDAAPDWLQARWRVSRDPLGFMGADHGAERTRLATERKDDALRGLSSTSATARRVAWLEMRAPIGYPPDWADDLVRVVRASHDRPGLLLTALEEDLEAADGDSWRWWFRPVATYGTILAFDALAAAADDGTRPLPLRRLCARLLAAATDLSTDFSLQSVSPGALGPEDPLPTSALWRAVRAASVAEGLRLRVDAALAEDAEATNARARAAWCVAHLPVPAEDLAQIRSWWRIHRDDDFVPLLAASLGLPADRPIDVRAVLAVRSYNTLTTRAHVLLSLIAPAGVDLPRLTQSGPQHDAIGRWLALFFPDEGPYRLRVGRMEFDLRRGWVVDEPDRFLDLDLDRVVTLRDERPLEGATPTYVTFRLPTTSKSKSGTGVRIEMDARLERGEQGLEVRCLRVSEVRFSPGGYAGGSGGGSSMPIEFVFCPHRGHGGGYPDPLRHVALLVVVEPRDAPRTPWTVATWRKRIADDLARLAARVEPMPGVAPRARPDPAAFYEFQAPLRHLAHLVGSISVPEATDAIRRLLAAANPTSGFEQVADDLQRALWLVKAPDAPRLELPAQAAGRPRSSNDVMSIQQAGVWMRALVDDPTPALRDVAARHLERLELGSEIAGDLLDAERLGRISPSPALTARVEASEPEVRTFWGRARALGGGAAFAVQVDLLMLLALVLAIRPRRRPGAGLQPRAWLVLLGVAAACIDVVAHGIDLLPDAVGLTLTALGAALLARPLRGRSRWISPIAFAVAAAVTSFRPWLPPEVVGYVGSAALSIAIAWVPSLAFRLRGAHAEPPTRPSRRRRFRWTTRWALALLAIVGSSAVLVVGYDLRLGGVLVLLTMLALASWALRRIWLRPAAPNHPWPWSFVLFYVLPVGAMFVGSLVAAVRGSHPWTISGTAAGVLLGMVWISSLVAMLSLVMAARVRAAWQRARASGAV